MDMDTIATTQETRAKNLALNPIVPAGHIVETRKIPITAMKRERNPWRQVWKAMQTTVKIALHKSKKQRNEAKIPGIFLPAFFFAMRQTGGVKIAINRSARLDREREREREGAEEEEEEEEESMA
jgi:hypothetical protein